MGLLLSPLQIGTFFGDGVSTLTCLLSIACPEYLTKRKEVCHVIKC